MKKLILSAVLAGFALAVQADDGACCAATQTSKQANAACPMAQQANAECAAAKQVKVAKTRANNATRQAANKQVLKSPKAYAEARG